jgi:hypothetical protein
MRCLKLNRFDMHFAGQEHASAYQDEVFRMCPAYCGLQGLVDLREGTPF